jgi:myo-inositol 2-dehydrogenase/D-chiro-inositol 1-dehydrogenase
VSGRETWKRETSVQQVEVAVIGTGWCGGIRAETLSRSSIVDKLHICEIRPDRLAEVKKLTNAATATLDYHDILKNDRIKVVYISTTPESNHYPIARDCLKAGKHVLLEKPIALELFEADELIEIARRGNLKFTIGYSQRFNPKFAYVRKCIRDATIGRPVTALVSRHITRMLGTKISGRSKLSPAAMEATHDLDFVLEAQILGDLSGSVGDASEKAAVRKPRMHLLPYGIPLCLGFISYLVFLH